MKANLHESEEFVIQRVGADMRSKGYAEDYITTRTKEQYDEGLEAMTQLAYQARFDEVRKRAAKDLVTDVKTGEERKEQELGTSNDGYKAAVIGGLLGSFEEKFWWWKLLLMLERAALAILVHFEVRRGEGAFTEYRRPSPDLPNRS